MAFSWSAAKANVRPVFRFETICPAIAASPVRPHFLGFHERLFGVRDFLVRRAVLEEPQEFFHDRGGDLVDVRRVGADGHRQ